jgi:hypothetical protein
MNRLHLEIVRQSTREPLVLDPRRMINAGYVGRDQAAVRQHIEELQREGVAPPPSIPVLFPMFCAHVTTASRIETVERRTSGEAEFVLIVHNNRLLVGIGSDHTDRALEALDMLKSKQACPNILGESVWDFEDVRAHWDRLELKSWVRASPTDDWSLYQDSALATILAPEQILELVRSRVVDHVLEDTIIFSGTVPVHGGTVIYGSTFRCALVDPVLQRSLECTYDIVHLEYLQP